MHGLGARIKFLSSLLLLLYIPASSAEDYIPPPASDRALIARLEYSGSSDDGRKYWGTDFPNEEKNLVDLIGRITKLRIRADHVKPLSPKLYTYPFIYVIEPEQAVFTEKEVRALSEYLKRGGFMWLDDFHGTVDWIPAIEWVKKIAPESEIIELTVAHPIFHIFFDITEIKQVLNDSLAMCLDCPKWENDSSGQDPKVFGVFNAFGDMQMIITYNTDTGDALEWADVPEYPQWMAAYGMRLATNIILWSVTH